MFTRSTRFMDDTARRHLRLVLDLRLYSDRPYQARTYGSRIAVNRLIFRPYIVQFRGLRDGGFGTGSPWVLSQRSGPSFTGKYSRRGERWFSSSSFLLSRRPGYRGLGSPDSPTPVVETSPILPTTHSISPLTQYRLSLSVLPGETPIIVILLLLSVTNCRSRYKNLTKGTRSVTGFGNLS